MIARPIEGPFGVTVLMESDWHVGTGAGQPGHVHSLVRRDADGLPFVPAKTLTGKWREACERVAVGLDEGVRGGPWSRWVDYLFGDRPSLAKGAVDHAPRPAALRLRSAHFPAALRQAAHTKPAFRSALTFIRPGVEIDPHTGGARKDFLRFEELARVGIGLEAQAQLDAAGTPERQMAATALLLAGSVEARALGAKVQRGSGRCRITVDDINDIEPWLQWLEANPTAPDLPPPPGETDAAAVAGVQAGDWVVLQLRITAKTPLIVAPRTAGNLVESLGHIPGAHLLPLLAKAVRKLGVDLSTAIAAGDVIVTNATLEVDEQPARPVPLALWRRKASTGGPGKEVRNWLVEPSPDMAEQWKPLSAGYIGGEQPGDTLDLFEVEKQLHTHSTIDETVGRPTSRVGGVYCYQAITPGTVLRSEIRIRSALAGHLAAHDPSWWRAVAGDQDIGRSKKDDYGSVQIEVEEPVPLETEVRAGGRQLAVWLLSDLLLRDQRLRPSASIEALRREIERQLGLPVARPEKEDGPPSKDGPPSAVARCRRSESWQATWVLPRPTLAGFKAGSCFVFTLNGDVDPARLSEIQARGLGERRAEGYGQVSFNDPLVTSALAAQTVKTGMPRATSQDGPREPLQQGHQAFARQVEREAWRAAIRRAAAAKAATVEGRHECLGLPKPSRDDGALPPSQLGALYEAIRSITSLDERQRVMDWLKHLEDVENRAIKWPKPVMAQVKALIGEPGEVWSLLQIEDLGQITVTDGGEAALREELWLEALSTLVKMCIRAHRRACEEEAGD